MSSSRCPYCDRPTNKLNGRELYGSDAYADKMFIVCRRCNAWVGCHPNGQPMGTLANASLRKARVRAHEQFDQIWRRQITERPTLNLKLARHEAYRWLAKQMGLVVDQCHIAYFTEEQCDEVVLICKDRNERELRCSY